MAIRLLSKQLRKLPEELGNHPGCSAKPFKDDIFRLKATITGPDDTPYEGGKFKLEIYYSSDYPLKPPKQLHKVPGELAQHPGCSAKLIKDDLFHWEALITGPDDTPYQGGKFELEIYYSTDYPLRPPKIRFSTKIFHPNVDENGMICIGFLEKEWKPIFSVSYVLLAICSLMMRPTADNPARPQIAELLLNDRDQFIKKARQMTQQFAKCQNMQNITPKSSEETEYADPSKAQIMPIVKPCIIHSHRERKTRTTQRFRIRKSRSGKISEQAKLEQSEMSDLAERKLP